MSLSRRTFFRTLGWGSAGLSTSFFVGGSRTAAAFGGLVAEPLEEGGIIRISNNENNRGPGPRAIEALHKAVTPRMGRGYPPDFTRELAETIAELYGVERSSVIVGTGSGPILEGGVRAYCANGKTLVTAGPSYGTPANTANRMDSPVTTVPVDAALQLDLDAMAAASKGAGLVYICNPNNPTGGALSAAAIERFVRRVKAESPDTAILIDEAYIDYVHDPAIKTAAPLAKELPGVFITRSFSKAHGMAGLRLGYAIGQPDTVQPISRAWQLGSVNTLTAAAGIASLKDTQHIAEEVAENARIRDFTRKAFADMGYQSPDSHANCIFVNLKRPAREFREACAKLNIQVGRDFPPMENTHSRITLGTMDEMRRAVDVFRRVLQA